MKRRTRTPDPLSVARGKLGWAMRADQRRDHPELLAPAQRDYTAERLARIIQEEQAALELPLTPDQRARLVALLEAGEGDAAQQP